VLAIAFLRLAELTLTSVFNVNNRTFMPNNVWATLIMQFPRHPQQRQADRQNKPAQACTARIQKQYAILLNG